MKCELCQQPIEAGQTAHYVTPVSGRILPGSELFKPDTEDTAHIESLT